MAETKKAGKRGAPPKVEGGLDRVLFVRANRDLLEALDAVAHRQRQMHRGRAVSRADVARELLYEALARRENPENDSAEGSS